MNLYVRALSCVALVGMALAALNEYRPAWAARAGLDWWSLPELHAQLRRCEQEQAALGQVGATVVARAAAKERVSADLRAGRLTLLQAAVRFRALGAAPSCPGVDLRGHYAGATEDERTCRQVISWVAGAVAQDESPDASEEVRRRLEAELANLLERHHGVIALPD
jgi:hypothetical protein